MYTRMVIGECLSGEQLREFTNIYEHSVLPRLAGEPGYAGAQLLSEEGGTMVIALMSWATREDCLRYHASRSYRQFVAGTQHLLVGNFVVKIFRNAELRGVINASADSASMDEIARALTGNDWNAETINHVADLVRESGRDVKDISEGEGVTHGESNGN